MKNNFAIKLTVFAGVPAGPILGGYMNLVSRQLGGDARLQAAANNKRIPIAKFEVSSAVAKLQKGLIDLNYPLPLSVRKKGEPDGIFGDETYVMLKQFQRDHALKDDGLAGPNTLARMDQLLKLPHRPPRLIPLPEILPGIERLIFKRTQQDIEIVRTVQDIGARDHGDTLGEVLKSIPGDLARMKAHPAEQGDPDGNLIVASNKKKVGAAQVLTQVTVLREFLDRGTEFRPGYYVLHYTITRSYSYAWGAGDAKTKVHVTRQNKNLSTKQDFGPTSFDADQPTSLDDP